MKIEVKRPDLQLVAISLQLSIIFARYDTRTIERYEGPFGCPEEVSLTSITAEIK
jgi:hypothetical protein